MARLSAKKVADLEALLAAGWQAHARGEFEPARAQYRKALKIDPLRYEALYLSGLALAQQGVAGEAAIFLRRALQRRPTDPDALYNLACVLTDGGTATEAAAVSRRLVALKPDHFNGYNALGVANQRRQQPADAAFSQAVRLAPADVDARLNLASTLRDPVAAAQHVRRALALAPASAAGWAALGSAAGEEKAYRRSLAITPERADASLNLANQLAQYQRFDEARALLEALLIRDPTDTAARNSLAAFCLRGGDALAAVALYRVSLALAPADGLVWNFYGNACLPLARLPQAFGAYRRSTWIVPEDCSGLSNRLMAQVYDPAPDRGDLADAAAAFRQAAQHLRFSPVATGPADRRLRLGFLSPDFGWHPVGYYVLGLFQHLNRNQFEIFVYSDRRISDARTAALRAAADCWVETAGINDDALADMVRRDDVDIAIDLSGHGAANRLPVLGRRPAPLQVTAGGHLGSSHLTVVDYVLGDGRIIPLGAAGYTEKVLRHPTGYVSYAPPEDAPAVGPLPAAHNGHVTLGCFQNPAKLVGPTVDLFGRVLAALPGSRMIFGYAGMTDPAVVARIAGQLGAAGIDRDRLTFLGGAGRLDFLARYNLVDLAPDTVPCNGGLTTCEALWMGVPVVTIAGTRFTDRPALSHLSHAELVDWVATSTDDYVAKLVALAGDLDRLATIRAGLRARIASSPLCDHQAYTDGVEHLLRLAWARRVADLPPIDIDLKA